MESQGPRARCEFYSGDFSLSAWLMVVMGDEDK